MPQRRLRGFLELFSETGTEGGYWAFQDERFITPNNHLYVCRNCHKLWDKNRNQNGPPDTSAAGCQPKEHEFVLNPESFYSYEGLVYLQNGDQLTIFDKGDGKTVVWSGTISLKEYGVFKEDAFGFWIHADQNGVPRETWARWFFQSYPAELVPSESNELGMKLLSRK